jgi:hypothetical protein
MAFLIVKTAILEKRKKAQKEEKKKLSSAFQQRH